MSEKPEEPLDDKFGWRMHNKARPEHSGKYGHYCNEFDGLWICQDCSEWDVCTCFDPNKPEKEEEKEMTVKPESSTPEGLGFESYEWDGRRVTKEEFEKLASDPNYCGLGKFNTGPKDPWWRRMKLCQAHDPHFTKLDKGEWATFGEFAKGIGRGMLEGAWMLLTGPVYLIGGGFLGVIRQQQLKKRRQLKEQNENLPPDLGDSL